MFRKTSKRCAIVLTLTTWSRRPARICGISAVDGAAGTRLTRHQFVECADLTRFKEEYRAEISRDPERATNTASPASGVSESQPKGM